MLVERDPWRSLIVLCKARPTTKLHQLAQYLILLNFRSLQGVRLNSLFVHLFQHCTNLTGKDFILHLPFPVRIFLDSTYVPCLFPVHFQEVRKVENCNKFPHPFSHFLSSLSKTWFSGVLSISSSFSYLFISSSKPLIIWQSWIFSILKIYLFIYFYRSIVCN